MFSEKILIGYSSTNIDEKNRLILPKFTCAEAGDRLIVIPEDDKIAIYFTSKLAEYVKKLDRITNLSEKKDLLIKFKTYCEKAIVEVVVDNSKTISLSSNIIFNNKNVIIQGSGDRLVLSGDFSYPELYRKRS